MSSPDSTKKPQTQLARSSRASGGDRESQWAERLPLVHRDTPEGTALIAIVRRMSVSRRRDEIVDTATHAARALLGADGVTFILREGEQCYYIDEDAVSPLWRGQHFPLEACISGWCMLNRQPAIIPDITRDSRIPQEAYRPTFVRSLAMVPVRQDEPIAAMGAYWATVRHANEREVELLQSIADIAALALVSVRLQTERDRDRRARAEVSHRMRNMIAVIDAMARQTAASTDKPADFTRVFSGRLEALARAQDFFGESETTPVDLHAMIDEQVALGAAKGRVLMTGAIVALPGDKAFEVALALHELGTNARKYGALSNDSGQVAIEWSLESAEDIPVLVIKWVERGGPPVRPPEGSGFGTQLIEKSLQGAGGAAELSFEPEGFVATLQIPLDWPHPKP